MHGAGWEEWASKDIYLEMELWVTVAVRGIEHFLFRQIFQVPFTSVVRDSDGESSGGCKFFFPLMPWLLGGKDVFVFSVFR